MTATDTDAPTWATISAAVTAAEDAAERTGLADVREYARGARRYSDRGNYDAAMRCAGWALDGARDIPDALHFGVVRRDGDPVDPDDVANIAGLLLGADEPVEASPVGTPVGRVAGRYAYLDGSFRQWGEPVTGADPLAVVVDLDEAASAPALAAYREALTDRLGIGDYRLTDYAVVTERASHDTRSAVVGAWESPHAPIPGRMG